MQIVQRINAPATRYHPSSLLVIMATAGRMLMPRPVMMITGVFIQKKISLSFCRSRLGMMMSPSFSDILLQVVGLPLVLGKLGSLFCFRILSG